MPGYKKDGISRGINKKNRTLAGESGFSRRKERRDKAKYFMHITCHLQKNIPT